MKIESISLHPYEIPRSGVLLRIVGEEGNSGYGDVVPLPKWSRETLSDSLRQFSQKEREIAEIDWTEQNCLNELRNLKLLPSLSFGLESALLSILSPLPSFSLPASALFMGSPQEILSQAALRNCSSAKLKVSNLTFEEAASVIHVLKNRFHLRIDVNRAWKTEDSLRFFDQFPLDTFDYVEEPFQNPHDLAQFQHPLAVDESFPEDLSLEQLEALPALKTLIYKPTIQGGLLGCLPLHEWAKQRGVSLVLSSSFESDLGLGLVASIAHRLGIFAPVGVGTYHYLKEELCEYPLQFAHSILHVPARLIPKMGRCPMPHQKAAPSGLPFYSDLKQD